MTDAEIDESQLHDAITATLLAMWRKQEGYEVADGDRVFTRWVSRDPADFGWDDWDLVGFVKDGVFVGLPDLNGPEGWPEFVQERILEGKPSGWFKYGDFWLNWCRSILDGPELRVSDWASLEDDEDKDNE